MTANEAMGANTNNASTATNRVHQKATEKVLLKSKKRVGPAASKSIGPKKSRKSLTEEQTKEYDIGKHLQRTKPGQKGLSRVVEKKVGPASASLLAGDIASLELSAIREDSSGKYDEAIVPSQPLNGVDPSTETQRLGLAERYQAICNSTVSAESGDFLSSQSFPFASDTSFELSGSLISNEHDDSVRHDTHGINEHSIVVQPFERQESASSLDFEPPLSSQRPRAASEAPLDAIVSGDNSLLIHDRRIESASIDHASFEDIDALLSNVKNSQRRLENFGESKMAVREADFAHNLNGWPDDVSMPDAVAVCDEDSWETRDCANDPEQMVSSQSLGVLTQVSGNTTKLPNVKSLPVQSLDSENEFDDSDFESSLIELTSSMRRRHSPRPCTSPQKSSVPKLQWMPPKTFTPKKAESKVLVGRTDVPHLVPIDAAGIHLPFVRRSFPKPILERSPILGLTNTTVLRTCFRIGEAINAATQGSRSKIDAIIELYARIISSSRDANSGFKQTFQFADLFTDKPPYLSGTSMIWKGVGLWDQDSGVFLGEAGRGKMCRVIGRIKKGDGQVGSRCEMTVLSIWEVDWEDVGVAKGVVYS